MDFSNKNVLITGASKGIGKATALEFAKRGARVGINYRADDKAAEKLCRGLKGKATNYIKQIYPTKLKQKSF